MGSSGEDKGPYCNFEYMLWEHDDGETFYNCYVCGYSDVIDDDGNSDDLYKRLPLPKALELAPIVGPAIKKLWDEEELSQEIFQDYSNNRSLPANIQDFGLGGVFIHLFIREG